LVDEGFRNDILGNSGCVDFSKGNSAAEYLYPILLLLRSDGVVVSLKIAPRRFVSFAEFLAVASEGIFRRHFNESYICFKARFGHASRAARVHFEDTDITNKAVLY
jgi:hypothetical protein